MTAPKLPAVIPFDGEDAWSVASHTSPGTRYRVSRTGLGLWSCDCAYGNRAAERLNTKPCRHIHEDVAGYLAELAEKIDKAEVA